MDSSADNPFGDLMSKAVKLKTAQQAQLRLIYDAWPPYFQHSMFMQESVTKWYDKPFDQRIEAAEQMKLTGNEHFGAEAFEEAVAEYEKALAVFKYIQNTDPGWKRKGIEDKDLQVIDFKCDNEQDQARLDKLRIACFLNIAVSKFKLKEYAVSIMACDDTLQVDPKNIKALYRRALALITPKSSGALEFDRALGDLQKAFELDPSNRQVYTLLRDLKEQKTHQRQLDKETFSGMFDRGSIYDDHDQDSNLFPSSSTSKQMESPSAEFKAQNRVNNSQEERLREQKETLRFEKEIADAENVARMFEAKGQLDYAREIRDKIEEAQLERKRRLKQIDFFHPTQRMIDDAQKEGIDLTDENVQRMLHQLQEEERIQDTNGDGGFLNHPNSSSSSLNEPLDQNDDNSIELLLKSMSNEEIGRMLEVEGIDYHKIMDREQFLETARHVLRAKFATSSKTNGAKKDRNIYMTVLVFAILWTLMRMYTSGSFTFMKKALTRVVVGNEMPAAVDDEFFGE